MLVQNKDKWKETIQSSLKENEMPALEEEKQSYQTSNVRNMLPLYK